jgi:hypothetical protein
MTEGVEVEVVEDQFKIWEDWMGYYQSHPVLGDQWTADEAECVIIAMMRKRGIYETDRQIRGGNPGWHGPRRCRVPRAARRRLR